MVTPATRPASSTRWGHDGTTSTVVTTHAAATIAAVQSATTPARIALPRPTHTNGAIENITGAMSDDRIALVMTRIHTVRRHRCGYVWIHRGDVAVRSLTVIVAPTARKAINGAR